MATGGADHEKSAGFVHYGADDDAKKNEQAPAKELGGCRDATPQKPRMNAIWNAQREHADLLTTACPP